MKRKLALVLAFIMLLGILPVNVFAAADAAKPALKNDKNYEEVTIDGMPYKVYKVADLMDKPSKERPMTFKRMIKSANLFKAQGAPEEPYTGWKFFLKLTWETIDRPIDNVTMPVYFGDPTDSRAIKLGHFVVTTGADQDQYIEMEREYFGTSPSIETLVKGGYHNIKIAIPKDMRYDFILAAARWDNKHREGIKDVNQKVIFDVFGKQSVMHGYGIRWYDTDAANRDKIDARWEGKENQTSDVKLGTVDRDYSVYKNNVIAVNDDKNVKTYPDGTQYSNYDYYYNGKKITTYADADNKGKYDDEVLAIASKDQAPTASLKVKDGNDYKLKGEKVLKNNAKYLYNSVGDYRTFHLLSMREALNVKLNSGAGKVNGQEKQPLNVDGKATQEIGHSEMIKGNESGREISFKTDDTVVAPKVKIAGKDVDATFAGWAKEPQTLTDGKLSPIKDKLVNADGSLTDAGKAYTFTTKETILYQVFDAPQEGKVSVKYVDASGTPIADKYKIQDVEYPAFAEGKKGEAVEASKISEPKFIGYKRTADTIADAVKGKTYKEEDANTKLDVVEVKYEKLPDIIPEDEATQDVKDTYKKVTIKVDSTKGKFQKNNADVTGSEFLYYVNPVEGKTLQNVLDASELKAKSNDENANKIDAAKPWKFTPDKTKEDTPADVALTTEVTKANFKDADVVMEVNFGQTTADKFKDKLKPVDIKVWQDKTDTDGSKIDWKKGVALKAKDDTLQGILDKAETKVTDESSRNSATANLPNGQKGDLKVTFEDGSSLEVKDQTLYVSPVKVKKDDTTDEKKLPDDKVQVDIKLGEGTQVGDTKGDKTTPVVYSSFYLKPGTGLAGSDFPAVDPQEGYKPGSVTWDPANQTKTWDADGAYVASAVKQTIAEKVGEGNLAGVDFGVWVGDTINWKKGVKVADSVTDNDLKTKIEGYLNDAKTEVTDATTPARSSAEAGTFKGDLTVTFSDGSTLPIKDQTLYVWEHKTENNDNNKDNPKPDDAVQVSFAKGTGVTALDPANKTMTVKPNTELEKGDFPTANVDAANGYVTPASWTGKVASLGHKVTTDNNVFTANANKGKSDKPVIPYEPKDPTKPTDKNDPNIPKEDDDHKTVDKNDYVVVAFNVAPKDSGTLTLGKITDKAVISALVMKGTDWSKVDLPTTNAKDPYTFWYWTDKTGAVAEGDIRTAHFIKSGDEIKPGDPALPDGFFKVTVSKGTGVEDNALFGKSYAVKKDDKLAKEKFPTLKATDGFGDPKWYKDGTAVTDNKPEEVAITGETTFIANATAFDKDKVVNFEFIKDPDKMSYDEGEPLQLAGLVIKLTDVNGATKNIGADELGAYNITIEPKDGTTLTIKDHNGKNLVAKGKVKDANGGEKDKTADSPGKLDVHEKRSGGFIFFPAATKEEKHETGIHNAYIFGYEDSTFRPEGNMTRAEAAAMLARLQGLDLSNKARPDFIDVRSGWYNSVINAVVNAGYMKGYPDGSFRPDGKITRAEFAQMIKSIDKANTADMPFADAKGHWAEPAIAQAYANGRITGYPDGTFRPDNQITRAEAVTVFNKLYDRSVSEAGLEKVKADLVDFNDTNRSHWAYDQIVEASNTHEFYRTEKGKVAETWVKVIQTWKDLLAHR